MEERAEHLPWVSGPDESRPLPVFDARSFIRGERRRAFLGDLFDCSLLLAVDLLVLSWESARFPFFTRQESLEFLAVLNVLLIGSCWLRRSLSRWRARRVATTWTPIERERMKL